MTPSSSMPVDCVICALPSANVGGPALAPYILKAYLASEGFAVRALDLNPDYWRRIGTVAVDALEYLEQITYETGPFYNDCMSPLAESWARMLAGYNARWIGLSLASTMGGRMVETLAARIKRVNVRQQIVVGGPGVRLMEQELMKNPDIDACIKGDGEYALGDLLAGKTDIPGVNGGGFAQEVTDMDAMPWPDFSSVDFSDYDTSSPMLYVKGSKGCVRQCKFCDTTADIPRYRYRSGRQVAKEMIRNFKTYRIQRFVFTDSLINGQVPELRQMCETLIKYYRKNQTDPFSWHGHFIIRPESQMSEDDFHLLKQAGCDHIKAGVEAGSERVRQEMGKPFSQRDFYAFLRRCDMADLKVLIHLVVGYPTETETDFQDTLAVINTLAEYRHILKAVKIGSTIGIISGTWLYEHAKELGIRFNPEKKSGPYSEKQWILGSNTFALRLERQKRLMEHIQTHGLMGRVLDPLNNRLDELISTYGSHTSDPPFQTSGA